MVQAAEDVPEILRFSPSAVEGMDEAIVATMRARRGAASVTGLPEGRAWLYVELEGDDQARGQRPGCRATGCAAEKLRREAGWRGRLARPGGRGQAPPVTVLEVPKIFGTFDDEDRVLRRASDTPWVSSVTYIFALRLGCGLRVSEHLEAA
ncbi:hypothetical protein [Streptomyces swartbergensis]|uniref:hypothetical protein n=1 Tax=Streptomyces swartbergensis TaxID=487165 RepID=UPI000D1C6A84